LLDSITYRELVGWGVYYQIEPWGEWRADARSAQISAILANTNRDPKKRPEPYAIKDFMMFSGKEQSEAKQQTGAKADPALIAWMFHKSGARIKET
jgi:hypothetical protein